MLLYYSSSRLSCILRPNRATSLDGRRGWKCLHYHHHNSSFGVHANHSTSQHKGQPATKSVGHFFLLFFFWAIPRCIASFRFSLVLFYTWIFHKAHLDTSLCSFVYPTLHWPVFLCMCVCSLHWLVFLFYFFHVSYLLTFCTFSFLSCLFPQTHFSVYFSIITAVRMCLPYFLVLIRLADPVVHSSYSLMTDVCLDITLKFTISVEVKYVERSKQT